MFFNTLKLFDAIDVFFLILVVFLSIGLFNSCFDVYEKLKLASENIEISN